MNNSVGGLISSSVERISGSDSGSDTARLDAELMLAHVLGRSRTWLFIWPEYELDAEQGSRFEELLQQRIVGKPIAHILGRREFWGLDLQCDEHTLIPRPETELLVETALSLDLPADARILDLGTGTGAIALALQSERPKWQVTAVDLIPGAIGLAQRNAESLGISRINWFQGSWFDALPIKTTFDLIVSNPPYVESSSPYLEQGDLRFEPRSALVSGTEGMDDIQQIISAAKPYLVDSGYLLIEHGSTQGALVEQNFAQEAYRSIVGFKDLAGLDRATIAAFSNTH